MLPYSVAFLLAWCVLFTGWIVLDLPLGPNAPLLYEAAGAARA
jgi:aminobenzoyl-glutamate transport protein